MPPLTPMKRRKSIVSHLDVAEETSPGGTITRHPSPTGEGQLVWPKADELWEVIGDTDAENVLRNVADSDEYVLATRYFCGRLQLLVRGLSIEEVTTVSRATMPSFFSNLTKTEQNQMSEAFEAAWEWAEAQTIGKIKMYAKSWFGTPAGVRYKIEYEHAL